MDELTKILYTPERYDQSIIIKGIMNMEMCLFKHYLLKLLTPDDFI